MTPAAAGEARYPTKCYLPFILYRVPQTRDLITQYLFLYSLSGEPQDFDSFVDNDYRRAAVWAFLKNDSSAYANALYQKAQPVIAANFPPGVSVRMGGILQLSAFSFYSTLSTLVIVTMSISSLFALFLLRALMMIFRPRFIFGAGADALLAKPGQPLTGSA